MKRRTRKIALIGPYGFGNLGDAAIQQAMIENIRRRLPEAEIYGVSLNPSDTQARHGIPSFPISRTTGEGMFRESYTEARALGSAFFKRVMHVLSRVALEFRVQVRTFRNLRGITDLIVSGGGQLDDYWGGPFAHPYTLLKWALLARLRGARVSFVSVGAGPINSSLSAFFIKRALSLAWYRSYRDTRSARLMSSLGFERGDRVYPDLAHSLKFASNGKPSATGAAGLSIGVGPMAYFEYSWPERDAQVYRTYLAKLSAFVVWALGQGHTVRLFPGEAGADKDVIRDLKQEVHRQIGSVDPARLISPTIETVDELLQELQKADVVVGSRFHGVLLAHLVGVPVVALSYHQKIDMLMKDMGHADYCLDIQHFTGEELVDRFIRMTRVLAEARVQVIETERNYRARLDEQYTHIFSDPQP